MDGAHTIDRGSICICVCLLSCVYCFWNFKLTSSS